MVTPMRRVIIGWVSGFALATILWFTLSPLLTDAQEQLIGWLLIGTYVVAVAIVWLRARRKADQGPST